jgi:hypothetical protein
MRVAEYTITLPDGSTETIPQGLCPVWQRGRWCATNTDAGVQDVAAALAQAEREATQAIARAEYLRGLMGRVLRCHPPRCGGPDHMIGCVHNAGHKGECETQAQYNLRNAALDKASR